MAYHRRTLGSLIQELKDSWESTPFWTDAEATLYINHALLTWNLLTGYWRTTAALAASGTAYQTLPAMLSFGMEVIWSPTGEPVQISALGDFDFGRPRWEEETTASGGDVPTRPILWAPVALKEIALWPAPPVASPLLVQGMAVTPVLTNPLSYVDIDDWAAIALVHYALHIACFKRSISAVQLTSPYFQGFIEAAAQQNARLRHSSYFRKLLGLDLERSIRPLVKGQAAPSPGGGQ